MPHPPIPHCAWHAATTRPPFGRCTNLSDLSGPDGFPDWASVVPTLPKPSGVREGREQEGEEGGAAALASSPAPSAECRVPSAPLSQLVAELEAALLEGSFCRLCYLEKAWAGALGVSPAGPLSPSWAAPSLALPMAEYQACLTGPFGALGTAGLSFAPRVHSLARGLWP